MAKKDAYYFSHDANAQDDPKCMMLIDQMGLEGYGIFWALIEKLRSEAEYKLPISILQSFAKRWGTSKEKVEVVVKSYSLFEIEDDYFFSPRLIRSMKLKSEKARLSANYRWNNANALQTDSERNANGMRKDATKGKEIKENERLQSEISEMLGRASIGFSYEQLYCEAGKMINKYDIKNSGEAVNLINKWAGNMVKETELQTNDIARYV